MRRLLFVFAMCVGSVTSMAQEPAKNAEAKKDEKPIKALLVTGGCCHDYDRQKLILTKGISARANVEWTIVHQGGTTTNTKIPLYEDANWAEGFDVIVHNECFSDVPDVEWVERILKPHREGTPAVLIHCAMHCYRTGTDKWFEFVGVQSPGHGPHYSYTAENIKPDHPIMQDFGPRFVAPKGELYHTIKLWPSATPLAQAKRQSDGEPQTCIWTNEYGKARVFCTTIGHYNETMVEPAYLDMVTKGLLWAVKKDPKKDFTPSTNKVDEEIKAIMTAPVPTGKTSQLPQKCCGDGNLVTNRPTKASSEETSKNNIAKNAVDGDLRTRWCAANADSHDWQVELAEPAHVHSLRIHWEAGNAAYRYKIDASANGETWNTLVDHSRNRKRGKITSHQVNAENVKHLRVGFIGTNTGGWGSFWEFEAYEGDLPELPEGLDSNAANAPPASIEDVEAPPGFEVKLFAKPPEVNYPVCLAAAATGEVFVGVDEQGSLGKEPGRGKILRLIDRDGDGHAERINEFAKIDHPRGLIYDNGTLWVLHPPFLSVLYDDDFNGTSDRQETLITGISTDQVEKRGADHTTNGIRMGVDGWIYIAVGDFGFTEAKGKDGTTLSKRGGGVVRVRPDGTEMEIFSWGQRNIYDVAIDPFLNHYTRDNTNDGGGWDVRVSHVMQSANYGYPSLYKNFTEEIMPPLADYGGGSGCGVMFLHDARWPKDFGYTLYTCDWGRSEVYRHNLPEAPPTFEPHQEVFLKIPRPTDIDVDGSGRMYVSSWKNGQFNYDGPNIGFVAQVVPSNFLAKPFPNLQAKSTQELVEYLAAANEVTRLSSQREILRRGRDENTSKLLMNLASDPKSPSYGRIAAVFTLKQLDGSKSHPFLVELTSDAKLREFALKALTDRKSELANVHLEPFIKALQDENSWVRAQACISLGRLGKPEAAEQLLPLTIRDKDQPAPTKEPLWNQPDRGRVIPHLAVAALVDLKSDAACLKALNGPYREGAIWALRSMHTPMAVSGLFQQLSKSYKPSERLEILAALMRLYHKEGEYKSGWWGTRPDTSGPYYDRQTWSESQRIAEGLKVALSEADKTLSEQIQQQLARHRITIDGLPNLLAERKPEEPETPIEIPKVDNSNPNLIANLPYEEALKRTMTIEGDAAKGEPIFRRQSCTACHTYINGQSPKGPHLVDIGKALQEGGTHRIALKTQRETRSGL